MKYYEIARDERSEVKRGIKTLRTYLINSAPDDDISEMSDYGMTLFTLQEIFTHVETKHGTLNQEDLEVIYATHHAVYGITHLRDIVVRGGINEIGPQDFDTTLDFAALVARYLIVFHSRGWGTWGRLCNSC